jgi:hypothetical protein
MRHSYSSISDSGSETAEIIIMKSSQVINFVNVEFIFSVSETISASIIRVDVIVNSDDGGRDSLQNVGYELNAHTHDHRRRFHCIL